MTHPGERMSETTQPIETKRGLSRMHASFQPSSLNAARCKSALDYIAQLESNLAAANERAERAKKDRDRWKGEYREWEKREAAACLEDCPFEEVIDTLRTQLAEAVEKSDVIWHDAADPPNNSRAVYCVREVGDSAWIHLGTFQHGGWRDTNTFVKIGVDRWTELPKTPKQLSRLTPDADASGEGVGDG